MPLYEYECTACHRRTEKIQKFSDPELTVCPHCGGPLERTITAAAVSFKGGGWYKDGYASAKPSASSDSGDSSGGDGSGSKSDAGSAAANSGDGAKSGESAKPTTQAPAAAPAATATATAKD